MFLEFRDDLERRNNLTKDRMKKYGGKVFFFFFNIQRVMTRAIPCLHQPPIRGDITVSVAMAGPPPLAPPAAFATRQGMKISN